jgi:hypothetical protein
LEEELEAVERVPARSEHEHEQEGDAAMSNHSHRWVLRKRTTKKKNGVVRKCLVYECVYCEARKYRLGKELVKKAREKKSK